VAHGAADGEDSTIFNEYFERFWHPNAKNRRLVATAQRMAVLRTAESGREPLARSSGAVREFGKCVIGGTLGIA
jgi:hypothetical protein